MGMLTFNNMMQLAGVPDKAVSPLILDIYFKAVNFEEGEDQEGNDDNSLIRFEFFEILVRIAKGKYVETKKVMNLAEATEKLINDHILQLADNQKVMTW